jgi:predicted carbohydrate-binding protein with CBM5 and CBM33 domain
MRLLRTTVLAAAAAIAVPLGLADTPAYAHGAMQSPSSRSYVCYQEGPENPRSAACRAVVDRVASTVGGRVEIGRSPLGGARIALPLPAASPSGPRAS